MLHLNAWVTMSRAETTALETLSPNALNIGSCDRWHTVLLSWATANNNADKKLTIDAT